MTRPTALATVAGFVTAAAALGACVWLWWTLRTLRFEEWVLDRLARFVKIKGPIGETP